MTISFGSNPLRRQRSAPLQFFPSASRKQTALTLPIVTFTTRPESTMIDPKLVALLEDWIDAYNHHSVLATRGKAQAIGLLPISWSRDNGNQWCGCSVGGTSFGSSSIGTYLGHWAANSAGVL
jgi:hypothetical protein